MNGSPSGEELEGESPRGGERIKAQRKAPSNFGGIFEKKVGLKYLSKNSGEKRGSRVTFLSFGVPKVPNVGVLESLLAPFLETFRIMGR